MLLGVASRRLGVPSFITAMFGRARARSRQSEADQRAALAFAEARERDRTTRQTKTSDALLARKRKAGVRPATPPLAGGSSILGAAPPPPAAQRPIGTPQGRPIVSRAPVGAPRVSTAERLAQKRREKK